MTATKIVPDVVTAQCSKLWLTTTCLTRNDWQKAHTMHTMSLDKILGILDKAENGERSTHLASPYILLYIAYVSAMGLAMQVLSKQVSQ